MRDSECKSGRVAVHATRDTESETQADTHTQAEIERYRLRATEAKLNGCRRRLG